MKWLIRLVIAIAVLVLIGVGGLYLSLNQIVKSLVQREGTEQLKVPTTLSSANLGIFQGTVDLNTFAIGSPTGFSAAQMLSVHKLSVDAGGVSRLRDQPIHLSTIAIDGPVLVVEQHGTTLNFRELINGLPTHPDNGTPTSSASGKPATKLIVDALRMSNAHVQLQSDIPGLTKPMDISLPPITMNNIGNADGSNNGVAIKDLVIAVITQMVAQASHSPGVPMEVQALLTGNLDQVQNKLTGAAQKELAKLKIPAALGGAANNAVNGLMNQGFDAFKGATNKPSH